MEKSIEYPGLRWLVLLAGGVAIVAVNMYITSFSPTLPEIARDLSIDIGTATNFM